MSSPRKSASRIAATTTARTPKYNETSAGCSSWLVPLLIVLGIAIIFYVWYKYSCDKDSNNNNNNNNNNIHDNGVYVVSSMVGGPANNPSSGSGGTPSPSSNTSGQVIDLTGSQLMQEMNKRPIFVAFFASGCGHCTNMKPSYHESAKSTKHAIHSLYAHNDGSSEALRILGINGFPTVALIYKGKIIDQYQGNRSAADLISWVNGH